MNIQIENGIDRNTCDQLRTALKELLDPIKSTGLSYEVGRIGYDNVNMKVSIEFFIKEGKEEQDKDMANQWLEIYDAKFRVGDEISYDGETYTIIGYKPKARKKPVVFTKKSDTKHEYVASISQFNQIINFNKIKGE